MWFLTWYTDPNHQSWRSKSIAVLSGMGCSGLLLMTIVRDVLWNLIFHILSHLHEGVAILIRLYYPSQCRSSLLGQLIQRHEAKWPGKILNYHLNVFIVVSADRNIPPFGNKTSRPAEYKVMGTGSKNCASKSSEAMINGVTFISSFDSWIYGFQLWEKSPVYWMLTQKTYSEGPEGPCLSLARY